MVPAFGSEFGSVHQIAFAHNADELTIAIDDRNAADPVIREQFRKFLYRSIGRNCNNVGGHYVGRTHRISLPTLG